MNVILQLKGPDASVLSQALLPCDSSCCYLYWCLWYWTFLIWQKNKGASGLWPPGIQLLWPEGLILLCNCFFRLFLWISIQSSFTSHPGVTLQVKNNSSAMWPEECSCLTLMCTTNVYRINGIWWFSGGPVFCVWCKETTAHFKASSTFYLKLKARPTITNCPHAIQAGLLATFVFQVSLPWRNNVYVLLYSTWSNGCSLPPSLTAIDLKNKWRETRMPRQTPFPLCWLVTHGDIFAGQFHVLPVWAGSWTHRNVWMRFSGLCDTGAEALKPLSLSWSLFLGQNHYWQLMDDKGIDQISTELSIRRKSWSCLGNWCAMNVIWT